MPPGRQYEFADARILRGVYRADSELLGRDMLLEGRFFGLRFYLGVRVTGVIDETGPDDGPERVWGWCYQTLEGHLEQGRLSYEVIKDLATGQVAFRVAGYSRRAPIAEPRRPAGFPPVRPLDPAAFLPEHPGAGCGTWCGRRSAAARCLAPRYGRTASSLAPSGVRPHPLERLARDLAAPWRLIA